MCGIAGIFTYSNTSPKVSEVELLKIRDHMLERGPDGEGLWVSENRKMGLAHRRLSILDLTGNGAQPMCSFDGRYQIIFNGEIYNFKELRTELIERGYSFRSDSDTEVILSLYSHYGNKMCTLLRGMYAFAIYDTKADSLFLARDPFGMKPLYWHDDGKTIRFASQVKALLAGGGIKTESEPAGVVGYWILGYVPEPYTLHKDLVNLEAGTWLKIDANGKKQSECFQSLFNFLSTSNSATSSYTELREALLDSVRHHLVSDVPVGIFLSSGIDSATILSLARECGNPIRSITLGFKEFKGTSADEVPLAEKIAKQNGVKHETIWLSQKDFENQLERYLLSMDQPTTDGLNTYLVSFATAQVGLKVALSGLGADELFGGYPSFSQIPKIHKLGKMLAKSSNLAKLSRQISAPALRYFISEKYAGILEYGSSWEDAYLLRRATRMPWEIRKIESLDKKTIEIGLEKLANLKISNDKFKALGSSLNIISYLELTRYMRDQLLRDSDWAGMAHSVEIRLPFLDISLIQFLVSQKNLGNTLQKRDIFMTNYPSLPDEILNRKKTGFSTPIKSWVKNNLKTNKSRGLLDWQEFVFTHFHRNL